MANEKRLNLIDRKALLEKQYNSSPLKALQFAEMVVDVRDIEDAPTVDAVEVVRCKDCKHYHKITETDKHCRCDIFCGCYDKPYPTEPDDFCSYGERRE